jgi:Fe-S-cluster containining protein
MATFGRNAEGVRVAGPWGPPPPFQPPSAGTREAMARLYEEVDASLAPVAARRRQSGFGASATACRACGKCCRFKPGGIVLFASAAELAYLVAEMGGSPSRVFDMPRACPPCGGPPLPGHACDAGADACPRQQRPARRRAGCGHATRRIGGPWRCPYQQGNRCGARRARLLGCRTYFCQAEARAEGERIYAGALREIRRIAEGRGPWWYGPARLYLERALRHV